MHLTKIAPDRYRRMPWKNGGGMTTELLARERPDGNGFLWRLSIAEVAMSGPFSDFSGYLRTIMLLEGNGFILKCSDAEGRPKGGKRLDRPYEPYEFDGAWKTDCSLIDGPIRDFNLMVARDRIRGSLKVHRLASREAWTLSYHQTTVLHLLSGTLGGEGHALAAGETLRIDAATPGRQRYTAEAECVLVVVALTET